MAGPNTRATHQVRCRSKTNPQVFVDVEVLDAITLLRPDGTAVQFALTNKVGGTSVKPYIVDNTGDNNGKGDINHCTRISHMERMTSQSDPTQYFDVEILDGFVLQPPQNIDPSDDSSQGENEDPPGNTDSGQFNAAQHALLCPYSKATTLVVDKVGLGLETNPPHTTVTRSGHINMVTDEGDTDTNTAQADAVPPVKHPYVATIKLDAINFNAPNGNDLCLIIPKSTAQAIDSTNYVTDPYTGETHAPPDNTDANHYVIIPDDSSGTNLGKTPASAQTGKAGPINQGLFWWIKRIGGINKPWFWYAPQQTPLAFSFFGNSPGWGYRGFQLFNYYPVIWILDSSEPLTPMGSFGAESLQDAASSGSWYTNGTIPNFASPSSGPNKLFGVLPFVDPPVDPSLFSTTTPNIWQMTGITQPNLANPNLPWNRTTNPYLWPGASLAEEVAEAFQTNWNSCANAVNAALLDMVPNGRSGDLWDGNPPGWRWDFGWTDPYQPGHYTAFGNGLEPGINHSGLPLEVFVPATGWTLQVGQLDPTLWDTRPALISPAPQPPELWSSE